MKKEINYFQLLSYTLVMMGFVMSVLLQGSNINQTMLGVVIVLIPFTVFFVFKNKKLLNTTKKWLFIVGGLLLQLLIGFGLLELNQPWIESCLPLILIVVGIFYAYAINFYVID